MRRLKIADILSIAELEARYRGASDGVARSQWQIIWLLAKGQRSEEVAEITGYSQVWIQALARRYNAQGEAGLGDGRHHNPGKAVALSQADQVELKTLLERAAAGEKWSSPQVAAWMSERLGRPVYKQRGWDMLRRLGFTAKTPRPRHAKANVANQQLFKKSSPTR